MENWSRDELKASVNAYVEMLHKKRKGQTFVKKSYYADLAKRYGRTEKAYEYRMQNISYVFSLMGRQWLSGLKPAKNVGSNVAVAIEQLINEVEANQADTSLEFETKVREYRKRKNLKKPTESIHPSKSTKQVTQYNRNPKVAAWVLNNANGICECCGLKAPFIKEDGVPFLEVHHVCRLADGGTDSIYNAIAVCPNCHRQFHYGIDKMKLVAGIYEKQKRLKQE